MYQEIQFHPWYTLDRTGSLGNNKTFFLASADLYLLARAELAAHVVAQLPVPASHERRGLDPGRIPDREAPCRRAERSHTPRC